jgi:hypothetical protein
MSGVEAAINLPNPNEELASANVAKVSGSTTIE